MKNLEKILEQYQSGELDIVQAESQIQALKNNVESPSAPLSEGQKGLWLLDKIHPKIGAYNIPLCFKVGKSLDLSKMEEACYALLKQFPILRTYIVQEQGQILQKIRDENEYSPEFFSTYSLTNNDRPIKLLRELSKLVFDLKRDSLIRVHVLKNQKGEQWVLIVMAHIIFDGTSFLTLIPKLLENYSLLVDGKDIDSNVVEFSYYQFIEEEQTLLASEKGKKCLEFWTERLAGDIPSLDLSQLNFSDEKLADTPDASTYILNVEAHLSTCIKDYSRLENINNSVFFLAVFNILLQKFSGHDDIVVGMPSLGRTQEAFDQVVGYFINMVPIRSKYDNTANFSEVVKNLQLNLIDALDHSLVPFPSIVKALPNARSAEGYPVFQVMYAYQNFVNINKLDEFLSRYQSYIDLDIVDDIHQEGEYPLSLEVFDLRDSFTLNFKYRSDIFSRELITRLAEFYLEWMKNVLAQPNSILRDFDGSKSKKGHDDKNISPPPQFNCMHHYFEAQCKETPDAIALQFEAETLTYRELNEKSTSLATDLQASGVRLESIVGVYAERSLEALVSILAILKAGGAYLPLDPSYPADRLGYMLEKSQAKMVLVQQGLEASFEEILYTQKTCSVCIDEIKTPGGNVVLDEEVGVENLAYVIFTSGSTGKPKGVMVTHKALANRILWMQDQYCLKADDVVLLKTPFSFDVSGWEIHWPLIAGAKTVIAKPGIQRDPKSLGALIREQGVTTLHFVPSMLNTFLSVDSVGDCNTIRHLFCSGEALTPGLRDRFFDCYPNAQLHNLYGPTEAAIDVSYYACQPGDNIVPIGKAINHVGLYVVDEHMNLCPVGVPGELLIGGIGLARGYINDPELTSDRFFDFDRFFHKRLYKTGDLVRYLPCGNIEYLGRIDTQVKIRGFRIELGEIENMAEKSARIDQCIVVSKGDDKVRRLVAYYTSKDAVDENDLKQHLAKSLPDHMIPARFIRLDEIPLSPSGKADRKALVNRKDVFQRKKAIIPSMDYEEKILRIWQEILGHEDFDSDDRFFDSGGDSLLAVNVMEAINIAFNVNFDLNTIFEKPSVKALSEHLYNEKNSSSINLIEKKEKEKSKVSYSKLKEKDKPKKYTNDVAIIGMSAELPKSKNTDEFWENLCAGTECSEIKNAESLRGSIPDHILNDPSFVAVQSSLEGKKLFDPGFFNISPKEAECMDPQFRMLLTHAWAAVEDAGYVPEDIPETAVYISSSNGFYQALLPQFSRDDKKVISNSDEYVSWVLGQGGTIPTMISYKLGFTGPSLFVASNCSSSLVGLNLAYEKLMHGDIKTAMVGAACISPFSNLGYVHQKGLNFSSDGHLKAFDSNADGMIGGEGVAVLLLKKIEDAIADNDNIYAVLKACGVNNDGRQKTGFYAPSVTGQSKLIEKVLSDSNIDASTIDYIEAHGTGTLLGDPIEVSALSHVYSQYSSEKQYCGIGSVKSNIGHLDTAAGLVGCIKMILALHHKQMPPTINYQQPNQGLKLDSSPFYVVDKLSKWEKREHPRRGAVSSFGIGGTNGHAIFEEYNRERQLENEFERVNLFFPLSAKNEERLTIYADKLLKFLEDEANSDIALSDLAYTLQVGRKAMDVRLMIVASDREQLLTTLGEYCQQKGPRKIDNVFVGNRKNAKNVIQVMQRDEDSDMFIRAWFQKGKLSKIAQLWVNGLDIAWVDLHLATEDTGISPRRISLPTYPFDLQEYWVSDVDTKVSSYKSTRLHPLVHENISNVHTCQFSTRLAGNEFFFAEHVVQDRPVLPAVSYLEMIREVCDRGTAPRNEKFEKVLHLHNIVWLRPVVFAGDPINLNFSFSHVTDRFDYQISSREQGDVVIHCKGQASYSRLDYHPRISLVELKKTCSLEVDFSPYYQLFQRGGMRYGSSYQAVDKVYLGVDERINKNSAFAEIPYSLILARLSLPESVRFNASEYVLHPSIMDAALHASAAVYGELTEDTVKIITSKNEASLPFAIEEVQVISSSMPHNLWAYIRFAGGSSPGEKTQKLDIDICDDSGSVLARILGYSTRTIQKDAEKSKLITLRPSWRLKYKNTSERGVNLLLSEEKVLLMFASDENSVELNKLAAESQLHPLAVQIIGEKNEGLSLEDAYTKSASDLLLCVQNILKEKSVKSKIHLQLLISDGENNFSCRAGLYGILNALQSENSSIRCHLVEYQPSIALDKVCNQVIDNFFEPSHGRIKLVEDGVHLLEWQEESICDINVKKIWKNGGVYLITGGAGGVGKIFAEDIAEHTDVATIYIAGRSEQGHEKVDYIKKNGVVVEYICCDVSQESEVSHLISYIEKKSGTLHGIIHAAGVLKDSFIKYKSTGALKEVFSSKVDGTVILDRLTQHMPLEFFALFSSLSAIAGSPGQADYASANAFLDEYAKIRKQRFDMGECRGRTVVINWGLWLSGGMQVSTANQQLIERTIGMRPIQTKRGVSIFHEIMASEYEQVVAVAGNVKKILTYLNHSERGSENPNEKLPTPEYHSLGVSAKEASSKEERRQLADKLEYEFIRAVSETLKIPEEDIDTETELSDYGFDSISLTGIASKLNEMFGLEDIGRPLVPTIFFEYTNISSFVEFMLDEYSGVLKVGKDESLPGADDSSVISSHSEYISDYPERENVIYHGGGHALETNDSISLLPNDMEKSRRVEEYSHFQSLQSSAETNAYSEGSIALVGMSGRFPHANNIEEFWQNILAGKSCVEEISQKKAGVRRLYPDNSIEERLRWAGLLDGIEEFDPLFFGLTPKEAEVMDPQQRLLLMSVWHAIEDAGIDPTSLSESRTGVFIAAAPGAYLTTVPIPNNNPHSMTGVAPSIIANRISYLLNLTGPSEYCDTACSSGLLALHRAIASIEAGECEQAIVGSVNLLLSHDSFSWLDSMESLSKDGTSSSFQQNAQGYVRSEGVAALVIKPMKDALRDKNQVYVRIAGTGISHGGKGLSLTAPNVRGMKNAMDQAIGKSGFDPASIGYIEAHGIASPIGDGLELSALKSFYKGAESPSGHSLSCFISSLKPVIGHCELTSGLAALIKASLALKHGVIPGLPGFEMLHQNLSLNNTRLNIKTDNSQWQAEGPLRAAINSYGFGGVNAHVLIEQCIDSMANHDENTIPSILSNIDEVIVISAKTEEQIRSLVSALRNWLGENKTVELSDTAYTLQLGRLHMSHRVAFVARSAQQFSDAMDKYLNNEKSNELHVFYEGEVKKSNDSMRDIFRGQTGEQLLQQIVAANNWKDIAKYWCLGAKIPWQMLQQNKVAKRISLPGYPFSKRRCWLDGEIKTVLKEKAEAKVEIDADSKLDDFDKVLTIIASVIGINADEINTESSLLDYGFDSIIGIQLLQELRSQISPSIDLQIIYGDATIVELINTVALQIGEDRLSGRGSAKPYRELILLNPVKANLSDSHRPVFWFHAGLGGVEPYQLIAEKISRPFYGVQAKGWMNDEEPNTGISAMAAYYVEIIRSAQAVGPYDLGGFSLGGTLAYEVSRILQTEGEVVNSIVMVDTMDGAHMLNGALSLETEMFQVVNTVLAGQLKKRMVSFDGKLDSILSGDFVKEKLIHKDSINKNLKGEEFLEHLLALANEKGLKKSHENIKELILQCSKVQHAYQPEDFDVEPLTDPSAPRCLYFRNKNGLFLGKLEPYFSISKDEVPPDHRQYWRGWEEKIENIEIIDLEVACHMSMLVEKNSLKEISLKCELLYTQAHDEERILTENV